MNTLLYEFEVEIYNVVNDFINGIVFFKEWIIIRNNLKVVNRK